MHSVSHLMITLFVSLASSSASSSSSFPLFPLPYCAAAPSLCRNHRGSCLFTLFLGIKAVAITRCQLYALPTPPPPPRSLFCVFLSPDTVCGLPLPSLGDLHGEGPMAEQGSPVCDKTGGSRAYGVCWVESVTENEQKSRRCWFVLWQRPPCLIRPQSLHSVWHHPNTAYGNEACIWLQLGEIWPPLHKSVQRLQWLWGRVVNQSQ